MQFYCFIANVVATVAAIIATVAGEPTGSYTIRSISGGTHSVDTSSSAGPGCSTSTHPGILQNTNPVDFSIAHRYV